MKKLSIIVIALYFIIGCKNSAESDSHEKVMAMSLSDKNGTYSDAAVDSVAVAAADAPPPPTVNEETITPKIIKNANLRFQSSDFENTYKTITDATKKYNAIIQTDNEGISDYEKYRNLTIRVPSDKFDAFLGDISKGVTYFDTKEISSQDVTEEYIDVASRIKTKKVLEERYLELLKKAGKVSEMLEIEAQLSAIREEIEAKEGRLKYLNNRVSFSTITLEYYTPLAQKGGATVSYGTKIWNAIKSGFNSISIFIIGLIENWPMILILGALIYFVRKKLKKRGWIFNKKEKK